MHTCSVVTSGGEQPVVGGRYILRSVGGNWSAPTCPAAIAGNVANEQGKSRWAPRPVRSSGSGTRPARAPATSHVHEMPTSPTHRGGISFSGKHGRDANPAHRDGAAPNVHAVQCSSKQEPDQRAYG